MTEHPVQRPGDPTEIDRAGHEARVLALAARSGAHEAVQLLLQAPALLRGLLLEGSD